MLRALNKMTFGMALPALIVVGGLVGCGGRDLTSLPYDKAWQEAETASRQQGFTTTVTSAMGFDIDPATFANAEARAEAASKDASTPVQALDEIVDDVSKYLVQAMPKYAKDQGTEWRLTLAVGTLVDGTDDKKLGSAMDRIARKLQVNDQFRRHFKVLSSTASDAEAVIKDLSGSHPDDIYLPDSDADNGVAKVHPEDLYVMTGRTDVFTSNRNRVMKTVTLIDVQHPKTRQVVLSKEFSRTYYFHPGDLDYITEAENQRRADELAKQEAADSD